MPNRVIKESIKRSPQIDALTWFEEVVFYRLIVTADDYGCVDGRPVVLKSDLFPTKESVTKKSIIDAITKLTEVRLVIPYQVDGSPYLYLTTWQKHQRLRKSRHKYPMPPPEVLASFSPQVAADRGGSPPESESESESNPNSNPNKSAEPPTAPAPDPVFQIPICSGPPWPVTAEMIAHWQELYPAVDMAQEIRKMIGWCEAHPRKKKTAQGVHGFVTGWLAREQDRGPSDQRRRGTSSAEDRDAERIRSEEMRKYISMYINIDEDDEMDRPADGPEGGDAG